MYTIVDLDKIRQDNDISVALAAGALGLSQPEYRYYLEGWDNEIQRCRNPHIFLGGCNTEEYLKDQIDYLYRIINKIRSK